MRRYLPNRIALLAIVLSSMFGAGMAIAIAQSPTSPRWRVTATTIVVHEWDEANARAEYEEAVECGQMPFLSRNLGRKTTAVKLERRDSLGWAIIKESRYPEGP